jgi:hypothetical protein
MPTLTLQPDGTAGNDCYIQSAAATTVANGTTMVVADIAGAFNHVLMSFDISSIPSDATIDDATLILTVTTSFGDRNECTIFRVTQTAWVEAQATWNVYTTGNSWATAGGDYDETVSDTGTPPASGDWSFNVINNVTDAVANRSGNLEMILRYTSEGAGTTTTTIASSDNATSGNRPELIINYTESSASKPRSRGFRDSSSGRPRGRW